MIQRAQTLFLFIASGSYFIQFITPVIKSSQSAAMGIYRDGMAFTREDEPAFILLALTAVTSLAAIFLFKNRNIQRQLVILAILLMISGTLLGAYSLITPTNDLIKTSQAQIFPGLGAFMPLIAFISLLLALRGIKKDETIVKSMDRLR